MPDWVWFNGSCDVALPKLLGRLGKMWENELQRTGSDDATRYRREMDLQQRCSSGNKKDLRQLTSTSFEAGDGIDSVHDSARVTCTQI